MVIAFLVEITQRRYRTSDAFLDATVGALEIRGNGVVINNKKTTKN
jgi:hypothetical protein